MDVTTQKLGLTQDELSGTRAALAPAGPRRSKQSDAQLKTRIGAVQADTATKFGRYLDRVERHKSDVAAAKQTSKRRRRNCRPPSAIWACRAA